MRKLSSRFASLLKMYSLGGLFCCSFSALLQKIVDLPWSVQEEGRVRRRLDSMLDWMRTADATLSSLDGVNGPKRRVSVAVAEKLLAQADDLKVRRAGSDGLTRGCGF